MTAEDYARGPQAQVYVMHHKGYTAVKVGICGATGSRMAVHRRHGWVFIGALECPSRDEAWRIENAVLVHLRLPPISLPASYLAAAQMPQGGWKETFSAEHMPPARLWQLVHETPARIAAQQAEKARAGAARREETVKGAAEEARSAPCPLDGDVLSRGQLFALFGRAGAGWHYAGLIARLRGGEVWLRNGPVMLGAIAVDPATWTLTGPYRVLLRSPGPPGTYAEVPLPGGHLPEDPSRARRRRLPPRRKAVV